MTSPIRIEVCRGENVESVHEVLACAVEASGKVLFAFGDLEFATYLRSAAKPFQALPFLQSGAAAHVAATDAEIALACASHLGLDFHIAAVAGLLKRAGLAASDLQNGEHRATGEALFRCNLACDEALALKQNCSGKHAAFLATQKFWGEPLASYREPDSRIQKAVMHAVADLSQTPIPVIQHSVMPDGCGAPIFSLPLQKLALLYAKLGAAASEGSRSALGKVYQVMRDCPEYIRGPGDLNTELIRAFSGRLVAKVGYEGVYGLALANGIGLAFKVKDGNIRALPPALLFVLRRLFSSDDPAFSSLRKWDRPDVENIHHVQVGNIRVGTSA